MSKANGQIWAAFFAACNGTDSVFKLPAGWCANYPVELTTDGTTPRYWRLRSNQVHWTIKIGKIYGITFELREAM